MADGGEGIVLGDAAEDVAERGGAEADAAEVEARSAERAALHHGRRRRRRHWFAPSWRGRRSGVVAEKKGDEYQ